LPVESVVRFVVDVAKMGIGKTGNADTKNWKWGLVKLEMQIRKTENADTKNWKCGLVNLLRWRR